MLKWRSLQIGAGILVLFVLVTNLWVLLLGKSRLLRAEPIEVRDCAVVLGAGVHGEKLSGALRGRMQKAVELYQKGLVKRVLVSGDGTNTYYSETTAMLRYAVRNAIPESDVIADPHGISTYASIARAHEVFHIGSAYIISQEFHLARAVWLANAIGMDAWGIPTGNVHDEWYYTFREIPARSKDTILHLFGYLPLENR